MNDQDLLINTGEKIAAALVRRMKDVKKRPIDAATHPLVVEALEHGIRSQDRNLRPPQAADVTRSRSKAVLMWLFGGESDDKKWASNDRAFFSGNAKPIASKGDGLFATDMSDTHTKLLGRAMGYIASSVAERLRTVGPPDDPARRALIVGDTTATFADGATFQAAWEWVENVGGGGRGGRR